jgi:hypothetical protein
VFWMRPKKTWITATSAGMTPRLRTWCSASDRRSGDLEKADA